MNTIPILGMDPSFRNWAYAKGTLDLDTMDLSIHDIGLLITKPDKTKDVRTNTKDIVAAEYLVSNLIEPMRESKATFVEIPYGSQGFRPALGMGVCFGILAAFRASGMEFFEIAPRDLKLAVLGKPTATKAEIYDNIMAQYPHLFWPRKVSKGVSKLDTDKIEHMADAIGAVHAGIQSNQFKRLLPLLRNN